MSMSQKIAKQAIFHYNKAMRISVLAKPGAKEEGIRKVDENRFEVAVKEPPQQGRANKAIAKALAKHFGVPQGSVRLVSGFASRQKRFEIY